MLVSECRVFQYIRVHLYPAFYQKTFETFNSASDQRLKVFLIHTQSIRKAYFMEAPYLVPWNNTSPKRNVGPTLSSRDLALNL